MSSNVIPFDRAAREQQKAINDAWDQLLKEADALVLGVGDFEIAEGDLHQPFEDE